MHERYEERVNELSAFIVKIADSQLFQRVVRHLMTLLDPDLDEFSHLSPRYYRECLHRASKTYDDCMAAIVFPKEFPAPKARAVALAFARKQPYLEDICERYTRELCRSLLISVK